MPGYPKGENMSSASTTHTELNHFDEQELITLVQNGNTEAFNPLVRKYQHKIYNLIYQRVGDRETAKDLCQEVFLKAWQALPRFKKRSGFYTWLYQIAVNCSIDFMRKRNKQILFACEELPQNGDEVLPMLQLQPSPCQILEKEELGHIIRKAVHQLPSGQRRAFRLRYFHELPIKKIASRLDKSEGTIKTSLHHARQRLRNMLGPYLKNEFFA
ncbi:sigma-70 family RNA polymerase sigma factor [Candidatus Poribacteria bacterium]|nr:sigma-70 family RNA polymerase sigma factor [Candidatus Poribacteria bacterium]MYB02606.1 sigma-70 family RNA polymerase sigma factor [Candidatus Poribacteria bacterium]